MEAIERFHVCIFKKDGQLLGHKLAFDSAFEKSIEEQQAKDSEEKSVNDNKYKEVFELFCNSMMGYIDILPFISAVTPSITKEIQLDNITKFLRENSNGSIEEESRIIFDVGIEHYGSFLNIQSVAQTSYEVGRQIPKMLMIGIVSSYEHHISLLIRQILKSNPQRLENSEKTMTVKEVFEAGDLDSFKEVILDKEIDSVMRLSFEEQVTFLEKLMGSKRQIKDGYKDWPILVEIFERRNLFTHTNGVVSQRYIDKAEQVGFSDKNKISKGKELFAGPNYFKKSLERISEFGLKIIQVSWRKMLESEGKIADKALTDFGFELIERGKYSLAIKVYEFYFELRSDERDELHRRMSVVNLSNAYKLSGDSKASEETLNGEDWSAVSDSFNISIAAVKGDVERVIELMKKTGKDCEIGENAYEEWPVFFHVRDHDNFAPAFESVFGRKFTPKAKERRGTFNLLKERLKDEADSSKPLAGKPVASGLAVDKDIRVRSPRRPRKLDA
ncbi:hypothetical protein [Mesorhizobium sp.]|uniref:hypothetical protein n=1 Tax=Mesorhizobium sp. TaxID=1871066 RepID=UPI000FE48C29|nr:hypothetical protein [Mesorhizobium sp.]RWO87101.1 MAG: hypothetical protein EOQ96_11725 [Mesorhizobium sp.]